MASANGGASSIQVPACSRCENPAVIHQTYSGQHLCHFHLTKSIHKRVSREIRLQLDLPKDARDEDGNPSVILVAISGGKDSAVLLDQLNRIIGPRRDIELVAGCVDEGIAGYRAPSMQCAQNLAESLGIRFETISYPDLGFDEMDAVVKAMPTMEACNSDAKGLKSCSYCGVFRRQGLNALAERVNARWSALGHNLDDVAQSVLMNLAKGEMERIIRLAPHTWMPLDGLAPRIVPLRWIPEAEIHAYAMGEGLPFHHDDCPYAPGAARQHHREHVAAIEQSSPGARHGLVHAMDAMRELWKATREAEGEIPDSWALGVAQSCERCGEPTSKPVCQACIFKQWLVEAAESD